VARGHHVTVYCRSHLADFPGTMYNGVHLVRLPTILNKYLETIVHSLVSSIHAATQGFDIALYFIAGNSPVTWIPRIRGTKTVLNVDGLDWRREKWPRFAKGYIQLAEWLATWVPNAYITDSPIVQASYISRFRSNPPCIVYGSEVQPMPAGAYLEKFGLTPRNYILFVGRLVRENCVHHLVQAFDGLHTGLKCVIIGGSSYEEKYISNLKTTSGDNVVFTGYLFGDAYRELSSHAYAFVETSSVGGTHPALIEAMAFGNCVLVYNTPENLETIRDAGFSYDGKRGADDLRRVLTTLLNNPELVEAYRHRAKQRALTAFSWEHVTDEYERLFYRLVQRPLPDRLVAERRESV
jgi:glycosyltransferase involved in cell wall biosynthesis